MFKRIRPSYFGVPALLFLVAYFQNCGQSFDSNKANWQSFSSMGNMSLEHHDHGNSADPDMIEKVSTTFEPVLADREYILNLLTDIFGEDSRHLMRNDIAIERADFGSPCSVYDNYQYFEDGVRFEADRENDCILSATPDFMSAPLLPPASVTRQADLSQTCAAIVSDADAVRTVLDKTQDEDPPKRLPRPNQDNIKRLVALFYRDKPDPLFSQIQSLQVMIDNEDPKIAQWQAAIYTVCVSNYWQVL